MSAVEVDPEVNLYTVWKSEMINSESRREKIKRFIKQRGLSWDPLKNIG